MAEAGPPGGETWIPAYRKLFAPDHHLSLGRPVCPRFAWLDLCQMATRNPRDLSYGHEMIRLAAGELVVSVRTLAERWKWSKSAVSRFLDTLVKRDTLRNVRGTPAGTVYLIENKDLYWLDGGGGWDSTRTPSGTGEGQGADKNNTLETKDTTTQKKNRARALPDDWTPNDGHQEIADDAGLAVAAEADKFRDHAAANGRTLKDWDAGFRNWLRKGAEMKGAQHVGQNGSGHGGGAGGKGRGDATEQPGKPGKFDHLIEG